MFHLFTILTLPFCTEFDQKTIVFFNRTSGWTYNFKYRITISPSRNIKYHCCQKVFSTIAMSLLFSTLFPHFCLIGSGDEWISKSYKMAVIYSRLFFQCRVTQFIINSETGMKMHIGLVWRIYITYHNMQSYPGTY